MTKKLFTQLNTMNNNDPKTVPDKSIFPTMGSIQEVIDLAESKLPITNKNELHSLLMTMSNTTKKEDSHE